MTKTHKKKTISGINWNFLFVTNQTLLSFIVNVALARLIAPSEFGLLALAMLFIGFSELISSLGMTPAVIRMKNLSERHIQTAFSLSLLMGLSVATMLWFMAPVISSFFSEQRLLNLIKCLCAGLLIGSLGAVSRGLLMRDYNFKAIFKIDISCYFVSYVCVGLGLATMGYGVWSLVWAMLCSRVLSSIALWKAAKPSIKFVWYPQEIRQMLSFGAGVSINTTINYFAANVDNMVIGRFLSANELGLYSRGYQLISLPIGRVGSVLVSAMLPSYAEIQDKPERLRAVYYKLVNATALITFPIFAGCFLASEYVISGLYGERWIDGAGALRILAVAGFFRVIFVLAGSLVQGTGYIYSEVYRQIIYLIILLVGALSFVEQGIEAVALAMLVGCLWLYLSMAQLVKKIVNGTWQAFFQAQKPGCVMAAWVSVPIIGVIALDKYFFHGPAELVLVVILAVSALSLVFGLLKLPASWVGEMPAWLLNEYSHKIPAKIRGFLVRK